MAEEKVMECRPYGSLGDAYGMVPTYFKLKKSFFSKDKIFYKVGTKWEPFCNVTNKKISFAIMYAQTGNKAEIGFENDKWLVTKKELGDNALTCYFTQFKFINLEKINTTMSYDDVMAIENGKKFRIKEKKESLIVDFDKRTTEWFWSKNSSLIESCR